MPAQVHLVLVHIAAISSSPRSLQAATRELNDASVAVSFSTSLSTPETLVDTPVDTLVDTLVTLVVSAESGSAFASAASRARAFK